VRGALRARVAPGLCAGLALLASCSLINRVDVCDRTQAAPQEANYRTEGSQRTDGTQPISPLGGGGALMVFSSVTDPNNEATGSSAIRGVLVDPTGTSLHTCDAPGEYEYAPDTGAQLDSAAVAMPRARNELGLLVWRADRATIMGQFVSQTGCPPPLHPAFVISGPGSCGGLPAPLILTAPAVLSLGNGEFAVFWAEASATLRGTVCGRMVHQNGASQDFEPTAVSTTGAPGAVVNPGNLPVAVRAAAVDEGRIALAWLEAGGTLTGQLGVFDAHLAPFAATRVLATPATPLGRTPDQLGLSLVWDGAQLFTVWAEIEPAGVTELLVRVFDGMGRPLRTPLAPDGEAVRLADGPMGVEGRVGGTALPQGGALFLYERRASADDTSGQQLRAAAFDAGGGRRFVNPACGNGSFDPTQGDSGRMRFPAAALLDGDVTALAWTVDGSTRPATDRSGAALRSQYYNARTLLPLP
jgi:hypothetical protein